MRVNIYAEEMTDRVEIISKTVDGQEFTGLRFYLYLPVTVKRGPFDPPAPNEDGATMQAQGPFIHREGDDDSSAVTFWGKRDLRLILLEALTLLDEHYAAKPEPEDEG